MTLEHGRIVDMVQVVEHDQAARSPSPLSSDTQAALCRAPGMAVDESKLRSCRTQPSR
jgi:hypothetical protein